jgi:hypothetical protein
MRSIGGLVAGAARPLAPIRSGKLAASIRPGAAATKATVRAGAAQLPYAGPIHYGWPARHIRPNPFLIDALAGKRGQAINLLEQELDNLLKQTNLK